jgi:VanZ family protein
VVEPGRRRAIAAWVAVAAWAGIIFWLSAQSNPPIHPPAIPFGDKVAHAGEYAILAALVATGLVATGLAAGRRAILIAALVGSLYGASDEIHQAFVPGRDADPRDWAADTAGALLGALAAVGLPGRRARASIRR